MMKSTKSTWTCMTSSCERCGKSQRGTRLSTQRVVFPVSVAYPREEPHTSSLRCVKCMTCFCGTFERDRQHLAVCCVCSKAICSACESQSILDRCVLCFQKEASGIVKNHIVEKLMTSLIRHLSNIVTDFLF
jgi:hypothetical protein